MVRSGLGTLPLDGRYLKPSLDSARLGRRGSCLLVLLSREGALGSLVDGSMLGLCASLLPSCLTARGAGDTGLASMVRSRGPSVSWVGWGMTLVSTGLYPGSVATQP